MHFDLYMPYCCGYLDCFQSKYWYSIQQIDFNLLASIFIKPLAYSAHKCLCYSSKNHNIQKTKMDSWDNSISEPILCWVPGKFLIGLAWGHTHYTSPTRNHLTIPSVHRTCLSSDRGNGIMRAIEINSYKPVCAELEAALWVRWILIWRSQMASGAGPSLLLMYWPSK